MLSSIILPWFPIMLSAAVGARLVGRGRGAWLGVTCALYFIVVVQMTTGTAFWADATLAASLLAGSAAIIGMADWSGRRANSGPSADDEPPRASAESADRRDEPSFRTGDASRAVSEAIRQFDDWLEVNRFGEDIWAAFDEFVRHALFSQCEAMHARTYRILSEGDAMVPLRALGDNEKDALVSARKGILGHVATTGRSFRPGDQSQSELLGALADRSAIRPAWCFAVRQGARTIGVVSVGQMDDDGPRRTELRVWEQLIGLFWTQVTEVCRGRSAVRTDPVSHLMTREAFFDDAQGAVQQSYSRGEPVAVCVIAVEGLRRLLDQGRWDLADDVVTEIGNTLRDRVRPDDRLGRFDEARFMLLLRRVDSELASLIASQLIERLSRLPVIDAMRPGEASGGEVGIRCGVSGSGTGTPSVLGLTADAVRMCHQAREKGLSLVSDVQFPRDDAKTVTGSGTHGLQPVGLKGGEGQDR